jgi:diadenosine tetraphosphate (Ap4A) HIT family hydrolase
MKDCPFCGFKEDRMLKKGKNAFVIFSNPRLMPGHLLVVSKRHIQRLSQMNKEERKEIIDFVMEFEDKILDKLASGCDIRQNFKPYVKNSRTHVNHLHFHLHPREFKDELHEKADVYRNPLYRDLPEEEKERLSKILES